MVASLLQETPSKHPYFKLNVLALELTEPCVWNFLLYGAYVTHEVLLSLVFSLFRGKFCLNVLFLLYKYSLCDDE